MKGRGHALRFPVAPRANLDQNTAGNDRFTTGSGHQFFLPPTENDTKHSN